MNDKAASLNDQAIASYSSGLLEEAIRLWQEALLLTPDRWEMMVYLGSACKEFGDADAAADYYERALALEPGLAEVHYNLGNIRQDQGDLERAGACYLKALALKEDFGLAAYNLGNVCRDQGRLADAIECYKRSIVLSPDHAPSYNNLGNALKHQGNYDQAIQCYQAALANRPDYPDALYNLGNAFYEQQDFAAALPWFDKARIRDAESRALYCCYKTRHFEEFAERLKHHLDTSRHCSPQVATLTAHYATNFGAEDAYKFCPQPFDFVYQASVPELAGDDSPLREQLLTEIRSGTIDERLQGRLHEGVQSAGNLFYRSEAAYQQVANLVRRHFDAYLERHRRADCELIRSFPEEREFESSWYIRMRKGGHLDAHIHESGWISGAIYLALPTRGENSDEGCFEVSVHGDDYPVEAGAGDFPSQLLQLSVGDIVLFPASLFHRTIPFEADEERICIAFDLRPGTVSG
jgi:Flp pilus assembly protein TadD